MKCRSALFFLAALMLTLAARAADVSLDDGWKDPPVEARLRAYWWWLNGNVTTNAITKDLEAMKAQGMGGGLIFDADGSSQDHNNQVPPGPMFGSPEWRELFMHTLREADRLGLKIALNIQSGWNLGGPTVTPDLATKHLVFSTARADGPSHFEKALPKPKTADSWYRDIAVVAIPMNGSYSAISASSQQPGHPVETAVDGDRETFWVSKGENEGEGPATNHIEWVQIDFGCDVAVGGIALFGRPGYGPKTCAFTMQTGDEEFQTLASMEPKPSKDETIAKFGTVTGRVFRLNITDAYDPHSPDKPRNVQLIDLRILGADGKQIAIQRAAKPIRQFRIKAGYDEFGGNAPDGSPLLDDNPAEPGEPAAQTNQVVDLTGKIDADGKLTWEVPAGRWEILRFGYTPSKSGVPKACRNGKELLRRQTTLRQVSSAIFSRRTACCPTSSS